MPRAGRDLRGDVEDDERHAWRPAPGVRRDCDPHRGPWVALAGNVSVVLAALALPSCGLTALAAVPLGMTAWVIGNADLARMRAGLMDPEGLRQTRSGREAGAVGAVLGGLVAAGYLLLWLAAHLTLV
jgi:hypothetical protein